MGGSIKLIPIAQIVKGRNPRKYFDPDELQELALSIKEQGLLQPIIVEPNAKNTYILVAGERRLRAHEILRRNNIKAIVRGRTNHNGRERFLHAIVENDQRVDMNPMERADAYQCLLDDYRMSIRDISKATGKAEVVIGNFVVLKKLDVEIQDMIRNGFWKDPRIARGLLQIEDKQVRVALAERLWKHKVSLSGCLLAIGKTINFSNQKTKSKQRAKAVRTGKAVTPVIEYAKAEVKPLRWDALKQLGRVPDWDVTVTAAISTCQACPLLDIASQFNCADCAAVSMLRYMTEAAK